MHKLINGLASAIKRTCRTWCHASGSNALYVKLLLKSNDIVILSENVMCFGRMLAGFASLQFHVGQQPLPMVRNYTYVGVVFYDRQCWSRDALKAETT